MGKVFDIRFRGCQDIMIHAFLLTATNFGMRYYEIVKFLMDHLKCTKYGIEFAIKERCKIFVSFSQYVLRI